MLWMWRWLFKIGNVNSANEVLWTWMIGSDAVNAVAPNANQHTRSVYRSVLVVFNTERTRIDKIRNEKD